MVVDKNSEEILRQFRPPRSNPWTEVKTTTQKLQPEPNGSTISENDEDLDRAGQETLSREEANLRTDQLDELLLTDPSLYEKMISNGILEDEEEQPDAIDG